MTPQKLKIAWSETGEAMAQFPAGWASERALSPSAKTFLSDVGLPADAAPFLSFGPDYIDSFEHWGLPDDVVPIGSNGAGDPVVITPEGHVTFLNHDAGLTMAYVNMSVEVLAEVLLHHRRLIIETQSRNGPDAYLDGKVPSDLRTEFLTFLGDADPEALIDTTLWTEETQGWEQ